MATGRTQRVPHGIWGAVLLPINERGEIDWIALADEVDILCASSLAGIYTNGTAAEFHNQTEVEFDRITRLVAERCQAASKPFQIGVSCTNPRAARERLVRIGAYEPMGVQFTLPDWWPPSPPEIDEFVVGMADAAAGLPLILYNPPHAKTQISLRQLATLRALVPGLVGTKVAGGSAEWYAERRRLLPGFSVFVAGHTIVFGRPLGANGAYSNVACLSPEGAVRHWSLIQTDPDAAKELEERIQKFMTVHILPLSEQMGLSNTAFDKLLAAAGGWGPVSARLLWPYRSASAEIVEQVALAARRELPELFT